MAKRTQQNISSVLPIYEDLSEVWDGEIAEHEAADRRKLAGLSGPPSVYEIGLAAALNHMVAWALEGKFKPHNEEDVQCFLYHALVLQFDDATCIRTKRTLGSPSVRVLDEKVGGMHMPDLIIEKFDGDKDAIYIELKVRAPGRKAFHQACVADVKKLAKHHDAHRQFFILYDCDPKLVYMSASQLKQLHDAAGTDCTVWFYPYDLNETVGKTSAAKAIAQIIEKGIDFKSLGKSNSQKAAKTRLAKGKAVLEAAKRRADADRSKVKVPAPEHRTIVKTEENRSLDDIDVSVNVGGGSQWQ